MAHYCILHVSCGSTVGDAFARRYSVFVTFRRTFFVFFFSRHSLLDQRIDYSLFYLFRFLFYSLFIIIISSRVLFFIVSIVCRIKSIFCAWWSGPPQKLSACVRAKITETTWKHWTRSDKQNKKTFANIQLHATAFVNSISTEKSEVQTQIVYKPLKKWIVICIAKNALGDGMRMYQKHIEKGFGEIPNCSILSRSRRRCRRRHRHGLSHLLLSDWINIILLRHELPTPLSNVCRNIKQNTYIPTVHLYNVCTMQRTFGL